MKERSGSGGGLKRELFIPVIIQVIVLVIFLVVIIFPMNKSRANLEEAVRNTGMEAEIKVLKDIAIEQLSTIIPVKEREEQFHENLNTLVNNFDTDLSGKIQRLQGNTLKTVSSSFLLIMIIITAASILTALVNIILGILISGAVRKTSDMLRDISEGEGDLTRRLEVTTKDEVGDLARYFNATIEAAHAGESGKGFTLEY